MTHDGGKTLEIIINELRGCGYGVSVNIYNSSHYGVAQSRERVYFVGKLGASNGWFKPPQPTGDSKVLADVLEDNPDNKYDISPKLLAMVEKRTKLGKTGAGIVNPNSKPANTITGRYGKDGRDCWIPKKYYLTKEQVAKVKLRKQAKTWTTRAGKQGGEGALQFPDNVNKPSRTVTTTATTASNRDTIVVPIRIGLSTFLVAQAGGLGAKTGLYKTSSSYRKLTPRECLRLQGFPDSFKIVVSDTQAYKQAGNAVTTNVVKAIGEILR